MEEMCAIRYRSVLGGVPSGIVGVALWLQMGGVVLGATPAFVQEKDNQITSGQTNSVTFSTPTASGNLLAAYAVWDGAGSVSVSDSLGNAYVAAGNPVGWDNGAYSAQIFYTVNHYSGADTVTATFSKSVKTFGRIYAHEYTGVLQASPVDVTAAGVGAYGSLNSGPATTANAVDLIFAGGASAEAVRGAGAGYTARSTAHGSITEDRVVSAAAAYSATASNRGGAWAMQTVAFKGASSGNSDSTPPSTPTGLSAAGVSSSQINLSWSTSTDPDNPSSQLTYGVFRNGIRIATTPAGSTAWDDTGLTASTTYAYTVCGYDPAGNSSAQSAAVSAATAAASNGSDTQPPVVSITSPGNNQTVSGVTTIAANASDNVGVAAVQFQLDGANLGAQLTSAPYSTGWNTTQTANGSHVLTAIAADAAGNRTVSSGVTVTINNSSGRTYTTNFPLTENPISEGGNWTNGGQSPALSWTNIQTTPGLAFGTMPPATGNDDDSTALLTGSWGPNQTVTATVKAAGNYAAGMEVEIRLRSAFAANSCTGYELDIAAGYIAIVRWNGPLNNFTVLASNTSANWSLSGATVKGTISGSTITIYVNGAQIAQATDSTYSSGAPGMGMFISQGGDSNQSDMGFTSFSATDGSSGSGSGNTVSSNSTDTTPPSTPANLTATVVSSTQINLSWSASTDNVGVAGYEVFRNGAQIAVTTQTSYSDTTVVPGVQYSYAVAATDAAGNTSSQSVSVSAATSSAPDSTPPSVPTNLQSSNVSSTSLTLTWSPSTDNVAVAGYRVYRNGAQVATTATASYNDTKLTASTTYTYTVAAYDSSGNVSAQSSQLLVTTAAPAMMPPSFVQVSHSEISSGSSTPVNFSVATQPGNTIVVYVIWNNAGAAAVTDSAGNTFQAVSAPVNWGSGYCAQIFYATNIVGGSDTVTAAFQTPVTSFGVAYAHEYAGIDATNPVDVTVSASGSSASVNSGSATTTGANDLIFGAGVSDKTVTAAGSGFVSRDLAYGNITEDRTAAAIGSYAATATHNGQKWGMQMVAFRAAQ